MTQQFRSHNFTGVGRREFLVSAAAAVTAILAAGCSQPGFDQSPESAPAGRPRVVATTTMLGDLVRVLAGGLVEASCIMRPGGDPHLYQPTPGDARLLAACHLAVTSGLHLEGWIDQLVKNAGGERPIVVATEGIEPIRMTGTGGMDPHFWFDVSLWKVAATNVAGALRTVVGATGGAEVTERLTRYLAELDALDAWVRRSIESIPREGRVLITSHDAFNYFGRAYGIDVVGIQGISTEQEAGQRDVANVVDLVRSHRAPAVFIESSVNPALVEQVARETGVSVAGPLYSDSIGVEGGPAGTYIGMVTENVRMITEALRGSPTPFVAPTSTGGVLTR